MHKYIALLYVIAAALSTHTPQAYGFSEIPAHCFTSKMNPVTAYATNAKVLAMSSNTRSAPPNCITTFGNPGYTKPWHKFGCFSSRPSMANPTTTKRQAKCSSTCRQYSTNRP